ncbi:putative NAD(P)-binding protein [Haloactinopolyspora alba]|uniref:Putative NAD(P)-binding protein n=1 Tax=Haloactinopolyspora alba TaxID=648780 RepID=A0A2P8DM48_9ACTN|nr:NAD-dependent epimerase/dehydratase family protein [Haloactinopolyspora alba]PSK98292.1 putative NAD(P)-binding protein [Haloactinopolyspora alba]
MRLLILGGTWFLGRTLAEHALDRGWEVTAFTRGRSGRAVPGPVAVHGDRTVPDDVDRLVDAGPWDAVIDTSGHEPANVYAVACALEPHARRYVYVSTVNVYAGWPNEPLNDNSVVRDSRPDLRADAPEHAVGVAPTDVCTAR